MQLDQTVSPKRICIVMTTYAPISHTARVSYAQRCIAALHMNLHCALPLHFIMADDGSAPQLWDEMADCVHKHFKEATVLSLVNAGIGSSLNNALREVELDDLWLYVTDDWLLNRVLDLTQAIKLIVKEGYDYVRLGPIHPNLHCITRFNMDTGWWLEIDAGAGGFAFATRPFLATKQFYNRLGGFVEHADAYEVETDYANRVASPHVIARLAQIGEFGLAGPWENLDVGQQHEVGKLVPA